MEHGILHSFILNTNVIKYQKRILVCKISKNFSDISLLLVYFNNET